MPNSTLDRAAAEWDAYHGGGGAGAVSPLPIQSVRSLDRAAAEWDAFHAPQMTQTRTAPQTWADSVNRGSAALLSGTTFGFGDEINAATAYNPGSTYEMRRKLAAEQLGQFRQESPYLAGGLEIGAGLAPMLIPGGGQVAAVSKLGKALMPAANAVKWLYTGGKPAASTLGRVATGLGKGTLEGALYGAGESEENRLGGAAMGGAMGGAFGLGTGLAGEAIGAGYRHLAGPKMPKGLEYVRNTLEKDKVSPQEAMTALQRMDDAERLRVPLLPAEAIDLPETFATSKYAANSPGGRNVAQPVIEARKKVRNDRIVEYFGNVSQSPITAGRNVRQVAKDAHKNILRQRRELFNPIYEDAFRSAPILNSGVIDDYVSEGAMSRIVAKMRREHPQMYRGLPDNHAMVVNDALSELGDEIQQLVANDKPNRARMHTIVHNRIEGEIERLNPDLARARERYAEWSQTYMPEFNSNVISAIKGLDDDDLAKAGQKIFTLDPDRLPALRNALGAASDPQTADAAIKNAVTAYLQDTIERIRQGTNPIKKDLLSSTRNLEMLEKVYGRREFERLSKMLEFEDLMAKGDQHYFAGSPTQGLQEKAQQSGVEAVKTLLPLNELGRAGRWALGQIGFGLTPEKQRSLAEVLFDPRTGRNALAEYQRYASAKQPFDASLAGALAGGERAAIRGGIVSSGTLTQPDADYSTPSLQEALLPQAQAATLPQGISIGNDGIPMIRITPTSTVESEPAAEEEVIDVKKPTDVKFSDDPLVNAMVFVESRGKVDAVSPVGAQGLMQLMPKTGKERFDRLKKAGILEGKYNPLDKDQNLAIGTDYIYELIERFGSRELGLAAYNWGQGNVRKAMAKHGDSWDKIRAAAPRETRLYVDHVKNAVEQISVG